MLALEGIKILDLTRMGPGPFCTMLLGDLGAEVIMIEVPPSAGERQAGIKPSPQGEAGKKEAIYNTFSRNKQSLGLYLKEKEAREIFGRLAEKADVVIEGFRPGVVNRLGIDYETVSRTNPGLIYCSITGYGQDGPYRDLPGHDINYISFAGALDMIGDRDGKPVIPMNLIADFGGGGTYAALAILSAVIARGKTGRGQYLDIALTDSVISLLTQFITPYFQHGIAPARGEVFLNGAYPYYNVYETKDGKFITIGCVEPWLWENLCREIGHPEWIPFHFKEEQSYDNHLSREKIWGEITAGLKKIFLSRTRDEWFDLLGKKNVPIGKVLSLEEVFTDPQVLQRRMVVESEHPAEGRVRQVGLPMKFSATPGRIRSWPPALGEQTDKILSGLGYDKTKVEELRGRGVVL